VRSVYLYVMCAVSVALIGLGAVGAVVGLAHTVAPDLGHRDTLDRVGIGLSNIGGNLVELFDEGSGGGGGGEDFCRDVSDNQDDFDQCVEDQAQSSEGNPVESIQEGINEVKDELRSQIRNNAVDHVIRGLLMIAAGVVLFRIHGPRTELFAHGLMPAKRASAPTVVPPTAGAAPPADPLPPPPGATRQDPPPL